MILGRRRFVSAAAAGAIGLMALPGEASTPEVIASIRSARQSMRTLQAKFEQERTLGLLATRVVSRGELSLIRPDQLRWELFAPDSITWWLTPAGLGYASARSHATADRSAAGQLAAVLDDILVVLGGDPARLAPRYDLEATSQADGSARVLAHPKDARLSEVIRSIEILLERDLI